MTNIELATHIQICADLGTQLTITGHPVGSEYVDLFWFPTLGPSSMAVLSRCNYWLQQTSTMELDVDVEEFGAQLGLSIPLFTKTIGRLARFGHVRPHQPVEGLTFGFDIRMFLPDLPPRRAEDLPATLRPLFDQVPRHVRDAPSMSGDR